MTPPTEGNTAVPPEPEPERERPMRQIGDAIKAMRSGQPHDEDDPQASPESETAPADVAKVPRHPLRVTSEPGGLRLVGSGEDDHPAYKPHAAYDESGCPGTLRYVDRTGPHWIVECDHEPCRIAFGVPRAKFDRDYRLQRKRARACLPERFIGRGIEPNPGNDQALKQIAAVAARWGQRDCPRPPMLVGRPGCGKTHLITAAALMLVERHEAEVWYVTVSDLLDEAKRNMETDEPVRPVFDRAATVALLALDDLGADVLRDWGRNELQALIDRRHRASLPIIGATNTPVAQWDRCFGERVASRLHDLSRPVPVTGEDWRRQ